MKDFPARLKSLRGSASMSDFARKIGVSVNTYQHYEYGKRAPSLSFIAAVCHEMDVSAGWLLGLTDGPAPGVTVTATGSSVAANHSTVSTGGGGLDAEERSRLLGIIESQQRVIESQQAVIATLTGAGNGR